MGFGLSPEVSEEGRGDEDGEECGNGWFFMLLRAELLLWRLRRREGTDPSSGLKEVVELVGLPFSWGKCAGE